LVQNIEKNILFKIFGTEIPPTTVRMYEKLIIAGGNDSLDPKVRTGKLFKFT
jgi:hypothetical protein